MIWNKHHVVPAFLIALTLLAGAALLWRFDPAQYGFYPQCQLYRTTGLQCPGCGGMRALHALLHGHVDQAFRLNPLFVVALPVILGLFGHWLFRRRREPSSRSSLPASWLWIGVLAVILFGIARNLPFVP